MKNTIPVFFSADDNYAPYLATSIASLIAHKNNEDEYKIVVLSHNMSSTNEARIKSLAKENVEVIVVSMEDKLEELTASGKNNLCTDYYSLAIYFRLFIPQMFPEYKIGIYSDSDVVYEEDVAELMKVDLKGNLLGACIDTSVQPVPEFCHYVDKAIGVDHTKYINSGILLMNLEALRDCDFQGHFLYILNKYHFNTVAPDQDYINAICYGKILFLDTRWNVMCSAIKEKIEDPKIVHFNLFFKPWRFDNVIYEELFWKYAELSGYSKEIIDYKNNYDQEKKEISVSYMHSMVSRAMEIADKEESFSSIFNTGIEKRI